MELKLCERPGNHDLCSLISTGLKPSALIEEKPEPFQRLDKRNQKPVKTAVYESVTIAPG